MRLPHDTCGIYWLAADDPQLTEIAPTSCHDPVKQVFLSALPAWEIALKPRPDRLPLPVRPGRYVTSRR